MTKNVIKIELPTTTIDFKIGKKTYSLSLADKSRARINKKYEDITKFEDDKGDSTQLVISRYQDAIDEIEKEKDARKLTDNPMTKTEELEKRQSEIAKFQGEVDKNDNELNVHVKKNAVEFLDYLFGKGVGDELYGLVDQNTIALSKIIFQVMTEFNRENDIYEYRNNYMQKLAALTGSADVEEYDE
jgi:hypothetical protein